MIIHTNQLNNGATTHTYVMLGSKIYCHSNNGRECLVFPAKRTSIGYEIAEYSEILDFALADRIDSIVKG